MRSSYTSPPPPHLPSLFQAHKIRATIQFKQQGVNERIEADSEDPVFFMASSKHFLHSAR